MKKYFILLAITLFFFLMPGKVLAAETIYYVATNGNNSYCNGLSPNPYPGGTTTNQPCAFVTIQKGANVAQAGDTVYVRIGTYKEFVTISNSGTASSRITFKTYQQEKVIIDGSETVGSWSLNSANIYKTSVTSIGVGTTIRSVVIDEKVLMPVDSVASMTAGSFYHDKSTNILYIWTLQNDSPANHASVGVMQKWTSINKSVVTIKGSYVTFSGFTVRHAPNHDILVYKSNFVKIESCETKFAIDRGILINAGDSNEVTNCSVHDNVLDNWPRGVNYPNGGHGQGLSYSSGSNGKFTHNRVFRNHGEGIGIPAPGYGNTATQTIEISHNEAYENWGVNIYIDGAYDTTIDGNYSYSTGELFDPNQRNSIPSGIGLALEKCINDDRGSCPGEFSHHKIINNITIGCIQGLTVMPYYDASLSKFDGLKNALIANNTFISNNTKVLNDKDLNNWRPVIWINNGQHENSQFINNIIYQTANHRMLEISDSISNGGAGGISFSHNLWFNTQESQSFKWNGTYYSFSTWPKKDTGSKWIDPQFINALGSTPADFKLLSTSPAINVGISPLINPVNGQNLNIADFWDTPRPQETTYDIGAYEYGSSGGVTPTDCPLQSLGDFNCDGKINESDLNALLGKWMTSEKDITGDGKVNESDLNKLLGNWKT